MSEKFEWPDEVVEAAAQAIWDAWRTSDISSPANARDISLDQLVKYNSSCERGGSYLLVATARLETVKALHAIEPHILLRITAAEKAARLAALREAKKRIALYVNDRLCEMKPDFDDSITGFNEANDVVGAALDSLITKAQSDDPQNPAPFLETFQSRVEPWFLQCFPPSVCINKIERADRFGEEAIELMQVIYVLFGHLSNEESRKRSHTLVDYVHDRPVGELHQEIGGVMVTLAALCMVMGRNMHQDGETELARISEPAVIDKIRKKQDSKRDIHGPLP